MPPEPITLCNKPTTNENFDYAFESFFVVIISNCDKEMNNSYPRLCTRSQKSVIVIFLSFNFGVFFSSNCLCLYSLRAFKVNTKSIKTHTEQLRFAAWRCPSEHTTQAFNFHYWPCGFIGLPGKVIAIFPLDSSGKHDFYIINFSAFFKVSLMKLAWPIKLTVDI